MLPFSVRSFAIYLRLSFSQPPLSLCVCLLSLALCLARSPSLCLSLSLCLSRALSLSLSVSVSFAVPVSVSPCLSLCLARLLCTCACACLSHARARRAVYFGSESEVHASSSDDVYRLTSCHTPKLSVPASASMHVVERNTLGRVHGCRCIHTGWRVEWNGVGGGGGWQADIRHTSPVHGSGGALHSSSLTATGAL